MTITNGNIPWVNLKTWQFMTPAPTASAAWSFVVTDRTWVTWNALYVQSATVHYVIHLKKMLGYKYHLWLLLEHSVLELVEYM